MEKRLVFFFIFSLVVLIGWDTLVRTWFPPPPKPNKPPVVAEKNDKKDPGQITAAPDEPGDLPAPEEPGVSPEEAGQQINHPSRRVCLGSLDPENYRMLVTLNSAGAAVERIELNQYRELDNYVGYLGSLALVKSKNQCKVQVVGSGTPAEEAGLQENDLIEKINDVRVPTLSDFREQMAKTKPGQQIKLTVNRGSSALVLTATLTRRPLQLIKPELSASGVPTEGNPNQPKRNAALSLMMSFNKIDDEVLGWTDSVELPNVSLKSLMNWELVDSNERTAVFSAHLPHWGLTVRKHYELKRISKKAGEAPGYSLVLSVEIENHRQKARDVSYYLDGPNGLPTEGYWYAYKLKGQGVRDVIVRFEDGSGPEWIDCEDVADSEQPPPWKD
ncbi:MAG: PDZ domain-containing protein, partial [Planctomycetales bacterium]